MTYSEPVRVHYLSPGLFSKATIFNATIGLLILFLPFFFCYRTQGFWLQVQRVREQPRVLWKHELLLLLDAKNLDGDETTLIWTTIPGLKSMLVDLDDESKLAPSITSREADLNHDSIKDVLDLEIRIPIRSNVSIHGFYLLLLFEYQLQKHALMEMESMILLEKKVGRPGSRYEFVGDMALVQKEPLWNRHPDRRYNYSVIPRYSSRLKDYTLSTILSGYAYRNVTTKLANTYDLWLNSEKTTGPTYEFSVKGRINYLETSYECWMGLGETVKWAWIQYLAFFLIFYMLLKGFQGMVFKARVFDTMVSVPWERRPW